MGDHKKTGMIWHNITMKTQCPAKTISAIGVFLAILSAILLAVTNVATPGIYDAGSNPSTILMLRAMVTTTIIAIVLLFGRRLRLLSPRDEINCLISGVMFMFAGIGLLTAFSISPVSIVVLVLYLFPLLTTFFDAIASRRLPGKMTLILMLVALFGLGLALEAGEQVLNFYGLGLALLAAISVAATFVWNNHILGHIDPEQITFRMFSVNLVIFTLYVIFSGSFAMPADNQHLIILIFILACFAVAFMSMFRAAQMAGPVRASMIMNLEPVASIFLSVIILAESINAMQAFGAALVLAAVLISQGLAGVTRNAIPVNSQNSDGDK